MVLVVVFALAFFAMRYTVDNLSMNTDTEHMLSEELVWRKLDQEYERLFPQYDNNILIVVEAATPDQAGDAAALLYERLQPEQALFEFVYYPNALAVFRESGLLYLDTEGTPGPVRQPRGGPAVPRKTGSRPLPARLA